MPQNAGCRATIGVGKTKMVIRFPFAICSPGEQSVLVGKTRLLDRLFMKETPLSRIQRGIDEFVEELGDYVDKTRLGEFSIMWPFVVFMTADMRLKHAESFQDLLLEIGIEADIISLEAVSMEAVTTR